MTAIRATGSESRLEFQTYRTHGAGSARSSAFSDRNMHVTAAEGLVDL